MSASVLHAISEGEFKNESKKIRCHMSGTSCIRVPIETSGVYLPVR